jgi:hypothetical protein
MTNLKKTRILLVAERKFPDGDAGGVRVRYMAKMFQAQGLEVLVLSNGVNNHSDFNSKTNKYIFDGITYINNYSNTKKLSFVKRYIYSGIKTANNVKKIRDACYNDVIVLYSTNLIYCILILLKLRKYNYCIWMDVVEFFHRSSYRYGVFNPRYLLYRICLYFIYPRYKRIFSISSYIERKYKIMGCKVVRMPPLYEYKSEKIHYKNRNISAKIKLIYSGNPGRKENLKIMLGALNELPHNVKIKYEMHFTGVSKGQIKTLLGDESRILQSLDDVLVFHSWMSYDALQDLYLDMNFLYFIRDANESNLANFPMKLIELMSFGVVPFVSEVGDYGRMLSSGVDSIVVDNISKSSTIGALIYISKLSNNDYSKLSWGAFNYGKKYFDVNSFANNNKYLEKILSNECKEHK